MLRTHDRSELQVFTNGGDDQVSIGFQLDGDFGFETDRSVAEVLGSCAAGEVGLWNGAAVDEYLHAVDIEPIGALNTHVEFDAAVWRRQVFAGSHGFSAGGASRDGHERSGG